MQSYLADAVLSQLGYVPQWKLVNASDFGLSQLRPRLLLVAIRQEWASHFTWPTPLSQPLATVGDTLHDLIAERGWRGADDWRMCANSIAPTIVGGSKKHGGPDLGPTRAKRAWAQLGVDGHTIAAYAPDVDFEGMPRLTVRMAARLQGFSDDWLFHGPKTTAYRQVGNAFPAPVACAVGIAIKAALSYRSQNSVCVSINLPSERQHQLSFYDA